MEGREPQQTCIANGKKACPPRQKTFITKFTMLEERASNIKGEASSLPGSRAMMKTYLASEGMEISSNIEAIMQQLENVGFMISSDELDYKHCDHIASLGLGKYDYARKSITDNCKNIAKYMIGINEHEAERAALQQSFANKFADGLRGIFGSEVVQPMMNAPLTFAAGAASDAIAERFKQKSKSSKFLFCIKCFLFFILDLPLL